MTTYNKNEHASGKPPIKESKFHRDSFIVSLLVAIFGAGWMDIAIFYWDVPGMWEAALSGGELHDGRSEADEAREEKQKVHTSLFESLQVALDEHIKEVRLSNRLTTSAVCLVGEEHDLSPQLLRMLESAGQAPPKPKRIMELNPEHPVLGRLQEIHDTAADDSRIAEYAQLLHSQALLAEGSPIPDPAGFANLVANLMVQAVPSGSGDSSAEG